MKRRAVDGAVPGLVGCTKGEGCGECTEVCGGVCSRGACEVVEEEGVVIKIFLLLESSMAILSSGRETTDDPPTDALGVRIGLSIMVVKLTMPHHHNI